MEKQFILIFLFLYFLLFLFYQQHFLAFHSFIQSSILSMVNNADYVFMYIL